jgi:hypothetical protein
VTAHRRRAVPLPRASPRGPGGNCASRERLFSDLNRADAPSPAARSRVTGPEVPQVRPRQEDHRVRLPAESVSGGRRRGARARRLPYPPSIQQSAISRPRTFARETRPSRVEWLIETIVGNLTDGKTHLIT